MELFLNWDMLSSRNFLPVCVSSVNLIAFKRQFMQSRYVDKSRSVSMLWRIPYQLNQCFSGGIGHFGDWFRSRWLFAQFQSRSRTAVLRRDTVSRVGAPFPCLVDRTRWGFPCCTHLVPMRTVEYASAKWNILADRWRITQPDTWSHSHWNYLGGGGHFWRKRTSNAEKKRTRVGRTLLSTHRQKPKVCIVNFQKLSEKGSGIKRLTVTEGRINLTGNFQPRITSENVHLVIFSTSTWKKKSSDKFAVYIIALSLAGAVRELPQI